MGKVIFICSPFTAATIEEIAQNTKNAQNYARYVALVKESTPFVPHLLYPQFLDDQNKEEREAGLRCGLDVLKRCDELWAFIPSTGLSSGMRKEIKIARQYDIPVREVIWDAKTSTIIE